jgi:rhodanese-related sulfurtransferase
MPAKVAAPTATFSAVREYAAAPPADAELHYLARLAVATDVSDVVHDLIRGTGKLLILDVRSPADYELCHVPGAINLPHRQINAASTGAFDKDAMLVTYCWGPGCNASTKAAAKLARLGFSVKEMIGGLEYWWLAGCPVERKPGTEAPLHWKQTG